MKYNYLLSWCCIGFCMNAYALPEKDVPDFKPALALPTVFYSSDSEGFDTQKIGSAFYPYYEHGDHYAGLHVSENYFSQHGWERDGMQYSLVSRNISPRTGMGSNLDVGMNAQGGHELLTTDSSWDKRWNDSTATEFFINRDWVETQNSLNKGISHTFAGGSVEQKIVDRLSLTGLAGGQYFSDGNTRPHGRLRLIYDLVPDYGLTLQLRGRAYYSSDGDVNGDYFNPRHYHEGMVALGMRRRIDGWIVSATAGLGRQYVNSDPGTNTQLVEIGVTSPVDNKVFLRTHAGYSQAAGIEGPNYNYSYVQCDLVFSY